MSNIHNREFTIIIIFFYGKWIAFSEENSVGIVLEPFGKDSSLKGQNLLPYYKEDNFFFFDVLFVFLHTDPPPAP